ncbi:MAG: MOSC domain-containing protein [Rhodospirillaceae bacterium]|nr:MOSC domain-containing protein [Rhodospirillaceae bacterium]
MDMWEGRVLSMHSCAAKSEPLGFKDQLVCITGVGIEGDRYTLGTGSYSDKPEIGRQITLIETETLEALARDWDITLKPEETRRNVVTEGAPLNHLVGRHFQIGDDVVLEGMRLNIPCQYLEDLLGIKSLFKSLINRSGLNCRIVTGGTIRNGDTVRPL